MGGKLVMMVNGGDGQIELLTDRVIIHRKGILNAFKHGFNARREIPIGSISSVHFRNANFFKMGEIDFDYAGGGEFGQNKVIFARKHEQEFLRLKEKLFDMINQGKK